MNEATVPPCLGEGAGEGTPVAIARCGGRCPRCSHVPAFADGLQVLGIMYYGALVGSSPVRHDRGSTKHCACLADVVESSFLSCPVQRGLNACVAPRPSCSLRARTGTRADKGSERTGGRTTYHP